VSEKSSGTSSPTTTEAKTEEPPPLPIKKEKATTTTTTSTTKPITAIAKRDSSLEDTPIMGTQITPLVRTHEKANKPPASTDVIRDAQIQEWVGKIRKVVTNLEKDVSDSRVFIAVILVCIIPKDKKIARMKTLMNVLKVDGKVAKGIYEKVSEIINHSKHPGLDKIDFEEVKKYRHKINELKDSLKSAEQLKTELISENRLLEMESWAAKKAILGVAEEALRIIKFAKEQIDAAFQSDQEVAEANAFSFVRRTLKREIELFGDLEKQALKELDSYSTDSNPSNVSKEVRDKARKYPW
jgi:hypothetical protein